MRATAATGYTVSQQTGTVNRYALKWQRDSANASTAIMYLAQSLETANVVRLKRGTPPTCYLSFYAKSGANYSGGNLTVDIVRGTGSDENVLDTYTGATTLATLAQAITGTLTRYSVSVPIDTSTNELGVRFSWTPSGVAGADDSVTLENVQLEVASAATDFEYLSFDETLAQCMRYYEKTFAYGTAPAQNVGLTGTVRFYIQNLPVQHTVAFKRVKRVGASFTATTYNPQNTNALARFFDSASDATVSTIDVTENFAVLSINAAANGRGALHFSVADTNF